MISPFLCHRFRSGFLITLITILTTACGSEENYNDASTLTNEPVTPTDTNTNTSNTPAIITGVDSGSITEDVDPGKNNLLAVSGKLEISDNDAGDAAFITNLINGDYGQFTIADDGNWSYLAGNNQPVIQNLDAGASLTDSFVINSIDGTIHTITITINGIDEANIPSVITGVDTGGVTEDNDPDNDGLLEVSGALNISDNNAGEAAFIARTHNGNFGSLSINAAGNWSYAASNSQSAIQNLNTGASFTDTLTVSGVDGTTHNIMIIIFGVDEINTSSDITLSWIAPAEREDNAAIALSEISGYKIYYSTVPGLYNNNISINDGSAVGYTFINFPSDTYYFVVTTIDTDNRESQHSAVLTVNN